MVQTTIRSRGTATLLLVLCTSLTASGQHFQKGERPTTNDLPAVLWRDPGNVATLDLYYGPGGKEHAPGSTYTFLKEDMGGSNPKFEVEDENGVKWKVKLGHESKSETAATRLLWAAGYLADQDYYVPELRVKGLPKLHRGQKYVGPGGVVRGARLERQVKGDDLGEWKWFKNPFIGQREYNGLRAIMALLNNWDLKDVNNSIHEHDGERRFESSDLGATFGRTGNSFTRSKSNLKDYQNAKFIDKVRPDTVDLVLKSRPFFLAIFNPGKYVMRARMERLGKGLPRADAKWLGERLAMLSETQIRDCFRASGYSPEEIEGYTKAVQKRISELNAL